MRLPALALCLLLASCAQPAATQAPQTTRSPVWEYKVKTVDEDSTSAEVERELAALGAEGWELVAVSQTRSTVSPSANHYSRCYFKRLKP